jgi:hypothetical protein
MSATREKLCFFSCGAGGMEDSRYAPGQYVAQNVSSYSQVLSKRQFAIRNCLLQSTLRIFVSY